MKAQLKNHAICVLLVLIAGAQACTGKGANSPKDTSGLIAQARKGEVVGVNEHQIQAIIESFKGKKVVLVNFWATWCMPCVEEFPDVVKLHQMYQSKGLEVIAISADDPKLVDSKIKPFLKKNGATFLCFVKETKDDMAFINTIDKKWGGELPTTFVYDRSGQRTQSFYQKEDWETFVAAVEPLLN